MTLPLGDASSPVELDARAYWLSSAARDVAPDEDVPARGEIPTASQDVAGKITTASQDCIGVGPFGHDKDTLRRDADQLDDPGDLVKVCRCRRNELEHRSRHCSELAQNGRPAPAGPCDTTVGELGGDSELVDDVGEVAGAERPGCLDFQGPAIVVKGPDD